MIGDGSELRDEKNMFSKVGAAPVTPQMGITSPIMPSKAAYGVLLIRFASMWS